MSEPKNKTSSKSLSTVKVPIIRELLAKLGTEQGVKLVGEACDLMSAALWEAFEKVKLPIFVKGMARGPLELAINAGKSAAVEWARKQLPPLSTAH